MSTCRASCADRFGRNPKLHGRKSASKTGSRPHAVKIAFHVGTDEPVDWTLARDLLTAASTCVVPLASA